MIVYYSLSDKNCLARWLHGQAVKTSPFHGGNTGSNPVVASSNPHLHYVNGGRFSLRYIKKETKIGEGISGYF